MGSIDELRVLIIGGGTCGLTIARGLTKVRLERERFSLAADPSSDVCKGRSPVHNFRARL